MLQGHNSPVTPNTGCDPESDPKHCKPPVSATQCAAMLRSQCQPKPSSWNKMQLCAPTAQPFAAHVTSRAKTAAICFRSYVAADGRGDRYNIAKNGDNFAGVTAQTFTDYTAEFLLTRGPYAILGYSW